MADNVPKNPENDEKPGRDRVMPNLVMPALISTFGPMTSP